MPRRNLSPEALVLMLKEHDLILAECVAADEEGKGFISVRAYRKLLEPQKLSKKTTKTLVNDFRKKKLEILSALGLCAPISPPTAEEKDAARILKRKFGIPAKLGIHVVRGRITKENALAQLEQRKKRRAAKAAKRAAELEQWKPVRSSVHSWPKTPLRRPDPPKGDFYSRGKRLPGSFGSSG